MLEISESMIINISNIIIKVMMIMFHFYLPDLIIVVTFSLKYQLIMKQTTTQFDFSAKPKVTALKPKYRERDEDRLDGTNLMNDPRVIRGNTYAAIIANKNQIHPPPQKKQVKEPPKKLKNRKINFDTGFQPTTPRAVSNREHFTTQTQPFVETLRDKPIQYEKESQTDLFLDRPVERLFNPMDGKTGVDQFTQIQENDPELFNFEYEVQPILDALLSKVIETSRMELFEEEQLREKEKQKNQYERRRHSRLVEAQKLQANEDRLKDEYERRQLQFRKSKEQEGFAQKKVISRIISKQYLKNLRQNTEIILDYDGFFRHPLQIDLCEHFVPWLYNEIENELEQRQFYRGVTEDFAEEGGKDQEERSQKAIKKEKERRDGIIREREEAREAKLARKRQREQERLRKEEEERLAREAEQAQKQAKQEEDEGEGKKE